MEEQTEITEDPQKTQESVEDDHIISPPFISQAREKRRKRIAEQKENRKKMKMIRAATHPSSSEEEQQSQRDLINKEYKELYGHILPKEFQIILHNEYHDRRRPKQNNPEVCDCNPFITPCCGSNCINRLVFVECTPGSCKCGDKCTNQTLQRGKYADLEPFTTEKKGVGLRTKQDLKPGDFVIEYVGEVISNDLCLERLQKYKQNDNKFYFLTLDANECIDAKKRGNLARFINHSCNPNCQTQKWFVQGEMRVAIFAIKNISAGTELTFDYQFERFGADKQECFCGESNCRGYLGEKQKQEKQPKKKATDDHSQAKTANEPSLRAKSHDHNTFVDELTLVVNEDIRVRNSKPQGYDGFVKCPYRRYKRYKKKRITIPFLFRNRNTNRTAYRKDYNIMMAKEIERLEKLSPEQFFSLWDE
mmetsp:Transcript_27022/g.38075  ORF Transcript_27022/g.38075 Transcript_27022/m.38075 type:complete len:420 (+) Transcript_27022:12-1271(+)